MSFDDFILEMRFFIPSEALTKEIVALNEHFIEPDNQHLSDARRPHGTILRWRRKQLKEHQLLIAERLYRYFASVARNSKEADAIVYIWDCIPHGMAVPLGFPP